MDDVLFKQFNSVSPRDLQKFQEIRQAVERQHSDILTTKASKRHYQCNSVPGASGQSREGRVEQSLGGIGEILEKGQLLNQIILRVPLCETEEMLGLRLSSLETEG